MWLFLRLIHLLTKRTSPSGTLASDEWIVLAKNVHPIIHDAILQTAQILYFAVTSDHLVIERVSAGWQHRARFA
jgi:hypothetical protein